MTLAATLGREHLYVLFEGLDHSCFQPFDYFYYIMCLPVSSSCTNRVDGTEFASYLALGYC